MPIDHGIPCLCGQCDCGNRTNNRGGLCTKCCKAGHRPRRRLVADRGTHLRPLPSLRLTGRELDEAAAKARKLERSLTEVDHG